MGSSRGKMQRSKAHATHRVKDARPRDREQHADHGSMERRAGWILANSCARPALHLFRLSRDPRMEGARRAACTPCYWGLQLRRLPQGATTMTLLDRLLDEGWTHCVVFHH